MANKRVKKNQKPTKASVSKALVKVEKVLPKLTQVELRRFIDDVVDVVNRALRKGDLEHDFVADHLFKELFDNDVERALDPEKSTDPRYLGVRERAGKSLTLDPRHLSQHIRVGALNQLARDSAWKDMGYSKKVELLPLVNLKDELKAFHRGVNYAIKPNVGQLQLRAFVRKATPRLPGSVGRPREVTLAASDRVAATGIKLGDKEERQALAQRIRKVPLARRRELTRDLRATIENLGKLLEEIDEDGEGDE